MMYYSTHGDHRIPEMLRLTDRLSRTMDAATDGSV
jgi:hypothetical protein